ncbi:hypothetical protein [Nocardia carnea]|uniref:hypothetical protein n=1 Tax=Nocardia carnea TaxID=37328 RepID=UPI0024576D01|nr:hypothetical protein [Nocardia carnea]
MTPTLPRLGWNSEPRRHSTAGPPFSRPFEFRAQAFSGNPHWLRAAMMTAGLDGIENRIEPRPLEREVEIAPVNLRPAPLRIRTLFDV